MQLVTPVKPPDESEPRHGPGGRRPPEYVVVVAASDWVREHFPTAGASLWDALNTGKDPHRDPRTRPGSRTMTATRSDRHDLDHQRHHDDQRPQRPYRPALTRSERLGSVLAVGQILDRNTAVTAMVLANTPAQAS